MIQRSSPIRHKFRPLRHYIYKHSERILAASYSMMKPPSPYSKWLVHQTDLMRRRPLRPADEPSATPAGRLPQSPKAAS